MSVHSLCRIPRLWRRASTRTPGLRRGRVRGTMSATLNIQRRPYSISALWYAGIADAPPQTLVGSPRGGLGRGSLDCDVDVFPNPDSDLNKLPNPKHDAKD